MPALALALLILYLAPSWVLGVDAPVLIHDHLDANHVWYVLLARSGEIFGHGGAAVPGALGDLPREVFPSEWNVLVWLHAVFDPFRADILNQLFMRGVALLGMFRLLRDHVLAPDAEETSWIAWSTALGFALLPFWPSGGLAIAGQPLLAHAYLNVRAHGGRAADWAVILCLPFYSYLVFAGIFFFAALGAFATLDALRSRRFHARFWGAIALGGLLHVAVEYRLLLSLLGEARFVSHRSEFLPDLVDASRAFGAARRIFLSGQYHAASVHSPVILTSAAIAIALGLTGRRRERLGALLATLGACAAIAGFYGLYRWQGFSAGREWLSLGVGFAADRFYTLLPLLWYVAFALALAVLARSLARGPLLAGALVAFQVAALFLASDYWRESLDHDISYRRFFAAEQFAEIQREIGRPPASYRVVSLGLHPSIAQYNGFRTADGYLPNYPLAQKHALRRVMRHELAKDPELARYFDRWGSRAYVFSAEIGRSYLHGAESERVVEDLRLDPGAMADLGVDFLLSALPIARPSQSGLTLRRRFTHPDSAWAIHLYERAGLGVASAPSGRGSSRTPARHSR